MRWIGHGHRGTSAWVSLALLAFACAAIGLALNWTSFGQQFNKYGYDYLFRLEQPAPWKPDSMILAIDEQTLAKYGGQSGIRMALADGLEKIRADQPAAVAVDVILAEPGPSRADEALEKAFAATHNLILASYVLPDDTWNEPLARFRHYAVAVGQVHGDFDKYDSVLRDLPLAKAAGHDRRWSLAFDAFLAANHLRVDMESPGELVVGPVHIPTRENEKHVIRIRYPPVAMNGIPRVSIAELDAHPQFARRFAGKAVFVGETVQARDTWMTPYSNSNSTPGIEVNASVYETLARRMFLTDASDLAVAGCSFALAFAAALAYALGSGWIVNLAAVFVVAVAQMIPWVAFADSVVWPWLPGTLSAVLAVAAGATWRHLLVRRELVQAEHEKTRYQKAMQFVTHEMRTPLTAIQGSSELISRYGSMPEAKRKQMAELINSESKRLARMIETFLSVERLSAGQMELKHERFPLVQLVERCAERARPYADRKQIEIDIESLPADDLSGDLELMEYAFYNLLTNAVKYSPPQTRVKVFGEDDRSDWVRLSVEDQGIGMDKKEVSRIFEKFYRTRRAEQSGEAGTGIGLSIVEQIVIQHGGSIHVESEPGRGSRFTLVLKRAH
ncbi:MAG TPA: CHASE2 domain-containing protein [Bryobacteraceae bacterium]|nr:CHASE2 domain-containing protein [Bryobacteraceae bacterium]